MNKSIIEYGKNGKGRIVHFREVTFDDNGNPIYILRLVDISKCNCDCKIGSKPNMTEEDYYKNSKTIAELRFYDKESIKILESALDKLLAETFMWEAC